MVSVHPSLFVSPSCPPRHKGMQASTLPVRRVLLALLSALMFSGHEHSASWAVDLAVTSQPLESLVSAPPPTPAGYHDAGVDTTSLLDLAWRKQGLQIRPYGAFWADMIYATHRTEPGAFTLFVFSPEQQGESVFAIDARRTRLGLDVAGPAFGTAETGGRVEIDFLGNFVTENRAGVLLRHAYWEAKDDRTRLLAGQTWDVVSPLIPSTLNYGYGYFAGNIGFRRAQFRAERFVTYSESLMFTWQGSLNQDIVTDFPTDPGVRREPSGWPVVEGRVAVTRGQRNGKSQATTLGLSGHIGETGFDFLAAGQPPLNLPPQDDARFTTWSFNMDLRAPITERFGFQGEFFTGANLSTVLGGVGQGVCPCLRVPVRSTGGWGELWYDSTPRQSFHLGGGIDDPDNQDSLFGRSSNGFIFVNVVQSITQQLTTGLEVTYWRTDYRETRAGQIPDDQLGPTQPGEAVTIDWMVKYEF